MRKIIGIGAVFSVILILIMMPVNATEVNYKIRSTVYDTTDASTPVGDTYWDAASFQGFWYKIKPGLSSEVLYIHNEANSSSYIQAGDEIAEGDLYYVSKPQVKKTKIGGSDDGATFIVDGVDLKKYYLMGFFGSEYLVMSKDPSDISAGCKPDNIAKILIQWGSDDKKQMFSGEEWELADGWSLVAQQVDVEGEKVWVQLNRDGEEVDTAVVSGDVNLTGQERTYLFKDADDNPVFYCSVDSIFKGSTEDFVVFKYAFLMDDIIEIENGATYGAFEVDGFVVPAVMNGTDYAGSGSCTVLNTGDDALVMSNNEDITLDVDTTIDLYGGLYLKAEDTSVPCLKMTLWKTCTITVPDTVVENTDGDEDEIVVVDLAGTAEETETSYRSTSENEVSSDPEIETDVIVQSSVATPGFELLVCFIGLCCASRLR